MSQKKSKLSRTVPTRKLGSLIVRIARNTKAIPIKLLRIQFLEKRYRLTMEIEIRKDRSVFRETSPIQGMINEFPGGIDEEKNKIKQVMEATPPIAMKIDRINDKYFRKKNRSIRKIEPVITKPKAW